MSNKQVAEAFAKGATKGHSMNMFIDGDKIYSYGYHFPMARRLDKTVDSKKVYLLTTKTYSNTTARHLSHVRWALRDDVVVRVWNVETEDRESNKKEMIDRLTEATGKLERARTDWSKDSWLREKNEIESEMRFYNSL